MSIYKKAIKVSKMVILNILTIYFVYNVFLLLLGYNFNSNYMNHSKKVEDKIFEIKNIEYSLKDYEGEKMLKSFNYKYNNINNDWFLNLKTDEILNDSQKYIKYLSENNELVNDYKNIMSLDRITNTNIKTINSPFNDYQTFSYANTLMGIKILKLFEDGKSSSATKLFENLHNQRHLHILNANTLISKLIFFNHLEKDLFLAKIVKEKYNINLNIKKLSYDHIDVEKAINSEIEMMLNLTPTLTSSISVTRMGIEGHFKINFMNEIGMRTYFKIIDYYKDTENKVKPQFEVFVPSFTEKIIAPIEVVLLDVATPDFFSYKDEFLAYNNLVNEYKSLN